MQIYVDMDGCIADFFSLAVSYSEVEHNHWRDMEFRDVERCLGQVRNSERFFERIQPYPQTNTLIQSIVSIADSYSILSSPLRNYAGDAEQEKRNWCEQHLLIEPKEIVITSNKNKYAQGNILIDDYGYNISQWERFGGYGIQYRADEDKLADVLVPVMCLFKNRH